MLELSKLIWFILSPLNLAIILLCAAVLCLVVATRKGGADTIDMRLRARRLSGYFGIGACAVLLVFAVLPTGYFLTSLLEGRYTAPEKAPTRVNGIIVLGGVLNTDIGLAHGVPQFNRGVDRLTTFTGLARKYPYAKLVYSGGKANNNPNGVPEADMAQDALKALGFNTFYRLKQENESRTTAENVANSKTLMEPKAGETWLLVTSAYHMPRAMGTFAAQDWQVVPYPTDYQTGGTPNLSFLQNLTLSHIAIKELLGTAAYALTGKWKAQAPTQEPD